jgi:hypothetical protein
MCFLPCAFWCWHVLHTLCTYRMLELVFTWFTHALTLRLEVKCTAALGGHHLAPAKTLATGFWPIVESAISARRSASPPSSPSSAARGGGVYSTACFSVSTTPSSSPGIPRWHCPISLCSCFMAWIFMCTFPLSDYNFSILDVTKKLVTYWFFFMQNKRTVLFGCCAVWRSCCGNTD